MENKIEIMFLTTTIALHPHTTEKEVVSGCQAIRAQELIISVLCPFSVLNNIHT